MRRLAIFSFSFAAAAAAYIWLLPGQWVLGLGIALLSVGVFLLLFSKSLPVVRLRAVALGLAVGLLWTWGYEQYCLEPRRALCGEGRQITVTVTDAPLETEYGCKVRVRLDGASMMLWLNCSREEIFLGDRLNLTADIRDATGSGENDFLYYQAKDISLTGLQRGQLTVERPEKLPISCWPANCALAIRERITEICPSDVAGFVRALLTGDRSGLDYELNNQLSITGISHVISVSGMHVSLLIGIVMFLTRQHRRLAAFISLPIMYFFAAMLGFEASVTRAVIMNTVFLLAPILHRENDGPTSLGLALLLILVNNPWAIAGVSLQLSFASMAGIFWFSPMIYKWVMSRFDTKMLRWEHPRSYRVLNTVVVVIAASFAATAATTPLTAYYFGSVSLISPLTNLLTVSVLSGVFSVSVGAVVLSVIQPLGIAAAWLLAWPIRYAFWVVRLLANIPYASVYTDSPYIVAWIVTAYGMLIAFLKGKRRNLQTFVGALVLTLLFAILFSSYETGGVSVTAFDVGQGQCILLENEGFSALVDCGGDRGEANGEEVARSLLMSGRSRVEVLVLTHFDSDHVCGAKQLMARVELGYIFVPATEEDSENRREIFRLAEEYKIPITEVKEFTQLQFSGGTLDLMPPAYAGAENASLAALMSVREYDILITGDMDMGGEAYLLRTYDLPDAEVLVAGHHGSKYSTGEELLAAICPEVVLISVGENSYGHPTPEAMGRIAASGAVIYRTDRDGTVTVTK